MAARDVDPRDVFHPINRKARRAAGHRGTYSRDLIRRYALRLALTKAAGR